MESSLHSGVGSNNETAFKNPTKPVSHREPFNEIWPCSGRLGGGQDADRIHSHRLQGGFRDCLGSKPVHLTSHPLSKAGSHQMPACGGR